MVFFNTTMIFFLNICILLSRYPWFLAVVMVTGDIIRPDRAIFTWMGMLKTKFYVPPEHLLGSSTLIILISPGIAIGMAKDIIKIDPETTEAVFWLANGTTWHCDVEKYELHPDHTSRVEAPALLFLIPPSETFNIHGLPIYWTKDDYAPSVAIIVGLDQDTGIILQTQKPVVTCNKTLCDSFYAALADQSVLRTIPRHSCYYEHVTNVTFCKYRSGMALVYETTSGQFDLFGIGVGGPGCASCSRWIHIHPFVRWIREHTGPHFRSHEGEEFEQGMYDYYEDLNQELNTKIIARDKQELDWSWAADNESEPCYSPKTDVLIYREQTLFNTNQDGGYGTYQLSIYDVVYNKITCVWLWVTETIRKNRVRWWVSRGGDPDDIGIFVKKVPISIDGQIAPKILIITDTIANFPGNKINIGHLEFLFTFFKEAELQVWCFAKA